MNVSMEILSSAATVTVNVVFWLTLLNIALDLGLSYYTVDHAEANETTRSLRIITYWYELTLVTFAVLVAWKCIWDRPDYLSETVGGLMAIAALSAISNTTKLYKRIEHHLAKQDAARHGFAPYPLENGEL